MTAAVLEGFPEGKQIRALELKEGLFGHLRLHLCTMYYKAKVYAPQALNNIELRKRILAMDITLHPVIFF